MEAPSIGAFFRTRISEAFQLAAIELAVRTKNPRGSGIFFSEEVYFTRFVVPGIEDLPHGAAMLAINLEPSYQSIRIATVRSRWPSAPFSNSVSTNQQYAPNRFNKRA